MKDSIGATNCIYNYYLDDIFLHRYGKGLGSKKYPIHFPTSENLKIGPYNLLSGDYITKYKNGVTRSLLSISKGYLIYYKEFYPEGQLKHEFIYSADCGAPIRHCIREYDEDGVIKYDGFNWISKRALDGVVDNSEFADSNLVSSGALDGNSYQVKVNLLTGESERSDDSWPQDQLIFDAGKMVSEHMQESERFYPSKYLTSVNNTVSDGSISFKYENKNPGGSLLKIAGTVQGKTISGTITWKSGPNKSMTRTYTFEGTLI